MTEKYYAPWVKSMQKMLDSATAKLDFVGRKKLKRVVWVCSVTLSAGQVIENKGANWRKLVGVELTLSIDYT